MIPDKRLRSRKFDGITWSETEYSDSECEGDWSSEGYVPRTKSRAATTSESDFELGSELSEVSGASDDGEAWEQDFRETFRMSPQDFLRQPDVDEGWDDEDESIDTEEPATLKNPEPDPYADDAMANDVTAAESDASTGPLYRSLSFERRYERRRRLI